MQLFRLTHCLIKANRIRKKAQVKTYVKHSLARDGSRSVHIVNEHERDENTTLSRALSKLAPSVNITILLSFGSSLY